MVDDSGRSVPDGLSCFASSQQAVSPVPASIPSAKTIAITDERGNRFVFPGWIIYSEDPDAPLATTIWSQAVMLCSRLHRATHDWITFDPEHFPHLKTDIGSAAFMHGSATAYIFAGPEFEEAQGMETRQGGDGTAPSRSDDSPVVADDAPHNSSHPHPEGSSH